MKMLVTGAGGFVGRALVPYLSGKGHEVSIPLKGSDGYSFPVDGVEAIIHLAGRAHILRETSADPLPEFRKVNVDLSRRLAEQAQIAGVRRFILMSSIGVLGNDSVLAKNGRAFTEADEPKPHDPYSVSKLEAEGAVRSFKGLETVVVRSPLIYGAGAPGNMRVLIERAKAGRPFPQCGSGAQRSFIGLTNLCSFLEVCATHDRAAGQTFVISDGEDASAAGFYGMLCRHLGVHPRILRMPEGLLRTTLSTIGRKRVADRLCNTLLVDSSKAREMLGWRPIRTMDEDIAAMAAASRSPAC